MPQMQETPQVESEAQFQPEPHIESQIPPTDPIKNKASPLPFLLIFIAIILLLGGGGYFAWQKYSYLLKPQVPVIEDELPLMPPEIPDVMPEPEPEISQPVVVDKSDALMIQEALAVKNSKQTAEVKLGISKKTEEFASGTVSFAGEIGGGWWLAALSQGAWVIVANGNGNVMCSDIKDYTFPIDMVPECYDDVTGQAVTR